MGAADLEQVRAALGGRYAIERELGRGGMGAVYLARDLRLDRAVALKVLPAEFAADSALRERFLRETRTSASFSHPNIVPVHAVEESDDLVAFAMGYVEGESLGERVRRLGPLGTRDLVRLLQDVGYALAYAHGRGVVHRDIKPDNVMIERATGRAQLMDFGIARAISNAPAASTSAGLTRVGEVIGTPEYMSPEQASGDTIDGRSDLYSLGLVAFFAATGQIAMGGATPQRILVRQLTEPVPSLVTTRPDLPLALTDAVDRCVMKEADDRFASAEALVEAIDATQLAAPDVPIVIRGFAQELNTLGMVFAFVSLLGLFMFRTAPEELSDFDKALPLLVFFGIAMARALQALSAARRLAELGFTSDETMRGLRLTVDEQLSLREQLRLDPTIHRRRRATVISAIAMIAGAIAMVAFAASQRVEVRPGQFAAPLYATVIVVCGLMMLGIGFVLLVRSPFRMPPGERVFRLLWLGPIGRLFIRIGARGVATVATATRTSGMVPVASRSVPAAPKPATLPPALTSVQSLEQRVSALEQWRERSGS
ncbi:MAG TPA: serine/threonine-protein kinase [Gemmatimonadaceae bacterium]|nr:serine/threonine-protein kinase [Gemmatimonadaceae bacterium]